jgi:hypothetical protein
MKFNILPTYVMLSHTGQWLENDELRAQLIAHPIGAALMAEVERIHTRLAGQAERRRQLDVLLAQLGALLSALDLTHDSMARAIHGMLEALLAAARDATAAGFYLRLRDLLFPEGLSIVSRTYSYEAGAIKALEARVTADDIAAMATIRVGTGAETLADWYRAWIESGKGLGKHVHERDVLLARTVRGGSAADTVDLRAVRLDWINIVRTFLSSLDIMRVSLEVRERLLSPLEASIEQVLRTRAGKELPEETPGGEEPEAQPGDEIGTGIEPAPGSSAGNEAEAA